LRTLTDLGRSDDKHFSIFVIYLWHGVVLCDLALRPLMVLEISFGNGLWRLFFLHCVWLIHIEYVEIVVLRFHETLMQVFN
jgi:uncharacterized membrane protein YagU involved in acid resistance